MIACLKLQDNRIRSAVSVTASLRRTLTKWSTILLGFGFFLCQPGRCLCDSNSTTVLHASNVSSFSRTNYSSLRTTILSSTSIIISPTPSLPITWTLSTHSKRTSVLTTAMISLSSTSTSWVTSKSTMQQSSHMKPSTATTITTHQPTSFSHITPSTDSKSATVLHTSNVPSSSHTSYSSLRPSTSIISPTPSLSITLTISTQTSVLTTAMMSTSSRLLLSLTTTSPATPATSVPTNAIMRSSPGFTSTPHHSSSKLQPIIIIAVITIGIVILIILVVLVICLIYRRSRKPKFRASFDRVTDKITRQLEMSARPEGSYNSDMHRPRIDDMAMDGKNQSSTAYLSPEVFISESHLVMRRATVGSRPNDSQTKEPMNPRPMSFHDPRINDETSTTFLNPNVLVPESHLAMRRATVGSRPNGSHSEEPIYPRPLSFHDSGTKSEASTPVFDSKIFLPESPLAMRCSTVESRPESEEPVCPRPLSFHDPGIKGEAITMFLNPNVLMLESRLAMRRATVGSGPNDRPMSFHNLGTKNEANNMVFDPNVFLPESHLAIRRATVGSRPNDSQFEEPVYPRPMSCHDSGTKNEASTMVLHPKVFLRESPLAMRRVTVGSRPKSEELVYPRPLSFHDPEIKGEASTTFFNQEVLMPESHLAMRCAAVGSRPNDRPMSFHDSGTKNADNMVFDPKVFSPESPLAIRRATVGSRPNDSQFEEPVYPRPMSFHDSGTESEASTTVLHPKVFLRESPLAMRRATVGSRPKSEEPVYPRPLSFHDPEIKGEANTTFFNPEVLIPDSPLAMRRATTGSRPNDSQTEESVYPRPMSFHDSGMGTKGETNTKSFGAKVFLPESPLAMRRATIGARATDGQTEEPVCPRPMSFWDPQTMDIHNQVPTGSSIEDPDEIVYEIPALVDKEVNQRQEMLGLSCLKSVQDWTPSSEELEEQPYEVYSPEPVYAVPPSEPMDEPVYESMFGAPSSEPIYASMREVPPPETMYVELQRYDPSYSKGDTEVTSDEQLCMTA